jgi:rRNA biogenesis protein RRP5
VTIALRTFREGDRVRAHVLSIDKEKRQLSFSLKPSHFAEDDSNVDDDAESGGVSGGEGTLGVVAGDDVEMLAINTGSDGDSEKSDPHEDSDSGGSDGEIGDEDMAVDLSMLSQSQSTRGPPSPKQAAPLKVAGFSWFSGNAVSDAESDEASSSDEGSEDGESSKRKKRRKKKEIEQDLTADMHAKLPESNADFERVLLGSPNSSYLWIQYMSFLLQLSEIDKARETGRRAIQTINFREEQERLNVWIALLNVENVYGTDESLEAVFKDAARHNDSKTIHLRLAAILDQSQKHEASIL